MYSERPCGKHLDRLALNNGPDRSVFTSERADQFDLFLCGSEGITFLQSCLTNAVYCDDELIATIFGPLDTTLRTAAAKKLSRKDDNDRRR